MDEPDRERVIDHAGAEVLTPEECLALLATTPVGRIAFVHDGDAVILPINIGLSNRSIVFSTQPGSKLDAAVMIRQVSVEIDGWNSASHDGWSVLVKGAAYLVTEADEIDKLNRLSVRSWVRPDAPRSWVRVLPNEITGRRLPTPTEQT